MMVNLVKKVNQKHQNRYKFLTDNMPQVDTSGLILKVEDTARQVKIDLMLNKEVEIENSMLIALYCQLDQRLHKLLVVLKYLNSLDNFEKLNSYSVCLLLLAYFLHEKYLPWLHGAPFLANLERAFDERDGPDSGSESKAESS